MSDSIYGGSGNLVNTGARSDQQRVSARRWIARDLREHGGPKYWRAPLDIEPRTDPDYRPRRARNIADLVKRR